MITKDTIQVMDVSVSTKKHGSVVRDISAWLDGTEQHHVVTVNPEMLVASRKDDEFFYILSRCALATADGVGILWASRFARLKYRISEMSLAVRLVYAVSLIFKLPFSLAALLVYPGYVKKEISERVSGVDLMEDLLREAKKKDKRVYLLGASDEVLKVLEQKFAGMSLKTSRGLSAPSDDALNDVNAFAPDLLFVALGAPRQEKWIHHHLEQLPSVKVAIGIGGAFDFHAGKIRRAPGLLQKLNVEWLWRLLIQPWRLPRILNATVRFVWHVIDEQIRLLQKVYRKNVMGIVVRADGRVLVLHSTEGRDEHGEVWKFAQGGIDRGESVQDALRREMREELGLEEYEYIGEASETNKYAWKLPFHRGYLGQEQVICYVRVSQDFEPQLNHEFQDFKWVALRDLKKSVHQFRKNVAELVQKDLG